MNKNVCYTCIFGNYEKIKDPKYISSNFDYICFTDNENLKSEKWKIIYVNNLNNIELKKRNRCLKALPHIILSNYEYSIYIDGSLQILDDLNIIKDNICKEHKLYTFKHPVRNCSYQEFFGCLYYKKDDPKRMYEQLLKYFSEGFPFNYGLAETCILCRYHNDDICKNIMNTWWNEINNHSNRDQLSLYYSLWKNNAKDYIHLFNDSEMKYIIKCFDYHNRYNHIL